MFFRRINGDAEHFLSRVRTSVDLKDILQVFLVSHSGPIMLKILNDPVLTAHFIADKANRTILMQNFPVFAKTIEQRTRDLNCEHQILPDELLSKYPVTNFTPAEPVLTDTCLLFAEHMEMVLYGEGGYYAQGKDGGVKFGEADEGAHFSTNATKNRGLALILAFKALQVFKKRPLELRDQPFRMVELSGGNGKLSNDILTLIQQFAHTSDDIAWRELYGRLQFVTYEISPGLAVEQMERNKSFVEQGKFGVINKSALCIDDEKRIDICVSNELFGMLQWNDFRKSNEGMIAVKVCLPTLSVADFEQLLDESERLRCLDACEHLPAELKSSMPDGYVFIDKEALLKIRSVAIGTGTINELMDKVRWVDGYTDVSHFPKMGQCIAENREYFDQLTPNEEHHVSALLIELGRKLASIPTGLGIHLDYSVAVSGGTHQQPRVYGEGIGSLAVTYQYQRNVDITYDPDFGLLARLCVGTHGDVRANSVFCHQSLLLAPEDQSELYHELARQQVLQEELVQAVRDFSYCKQDFNFMAYTHHNPIHDYISRPGFVIGRPHIEDTSHIYGQDEVQYVHELRKEIINQTKPGALYTAAHTAYTGPSHHGDHVAESMPAASSSSFFHDSNHPPHSPDPRMGKGKSKTTSRIQQDSKTRSSRTASNDETIATSSAPNKSSRRENR